MDDDFTKKYIKTLGEKITSKQLIISNSYFGNFPPINIDDDFLKAILIDPFSETSPNNQNLKTLIDKYLHIKNFLTKGSVYFDCLSIIYEREKLSLSEKKQRYKEIRLKSINHINSILSNKIPLDAKNSKKKYIEQYNIIKKEFDSFNFEIKELLPYKYIDTALRACILHKINIQTCPYCNRQYIDTYKKKNKKTVAIAQLDHFYPQSIFPLFSLTLANFVPSCAYCNTILKRAHLFPLNYPYFESNNLDNIFNVELKEIKDTYRPNEVEISFNKKNKYYEQLEFFDIKEIYENHRAYIANLVNKRKLFNNPYKKSLENILNKEISDDEFKIYLFNTTGNDSDISKTPLAKLTKDIIYL